MAAARIPTRHVLTPVSDPDTGAHRGVLPLDFSVLCLTCRRWTDNMRCEAFPGGIPAEIRDGEFDHRAPHPGDRGLRWEQAPGVAPAPELEPDRAR